MNLCKVLGHKQADSTFDNEVICERCGSHGYYNQDEWEVAWFAWHLRMWWRFLEWWMITTENTPIHLRRWWNHLWIAKPKRNGKPIDDDDIPF